MSARTGPGSTSCARRSTGGRRGRQPRGRRPGAAADRPRVLAARHRHRRHRARSGRARVARRRPAGVEPGGREVRVRSVAGARPAGRASGGRPAGRAGARRRRATPGRGAARRWPRPGALPPILPARVPARRCCPLRRAACATASRVTVHHGTAEAPAPGRRARAAARCRRAPPADVQLRLRPAGRRAGGDRVIVRLTRPRSPSPAAPSPTRVRRGGAGRPQRAARACRARRRPAVRRRPRRSCYARLAREAAARRRRSAPTTRGRSPHLVAAGPGGASRARPGLHRRGVRAGASGGRGAGRRAPAASRWPSCATGSGSRASTPRRCSRRSTHAASRAASATSASCAAAPTSPETPAPGANVSPLPARRAVGSDVCCRSRHERSGPWQSPRHPTSPPSSRSSADDAESLLGHTCNTIPRERLHLPGPDFVDRVVAAVRPADPRAALDADDPRSRPPGRHRVRVDPARSTRASSTPPARRSRRTRLLRSERIVELAIEGGCNAVATTLGALGATARRYAHRIPFLLKLNHNEFLSYPNTYDQIMFASVRQAREQGCVAVGATIYFGSPESRRQIQEVTTAFAAAHELGMATVLWCYLRNSAFSAEGRRPRLPRGGRPDRPGEPPRRDDRGRHHQAEGARDGGAGLPRPEVRQDRQARLLRAHERPPDRHDPLPGRQLLHGPRGPHQLGRRLSARATCTTPSSPPSSTSAPAAWA